MNISATRLKKIGFDKLISLASGCFQTSNLSGICIFLSLIFIVPPACAGIANSSLCLPSEGTYWFGVHPPIRYHQTEMEVTRHSISSFADSAGITPAIITFSHEWGSNRSFPHTQLKDIHTYGSTPWVRLMLRSDNRQNKPEPIFTLNRIITGTYDKDFRSWAHHAQQLGYPIIIEYGTEVNGKWFSWNGYWTGNAQGPLKFKEAYRHIIRIMKDEGADNLIWVYHVNWHNNPEEPWNTAKAYYPGDEYIDLFAISAYGALSPDATNIRSFSDMIDEMYLELTEINPDMPIIVAETGTDIRSRESYPISWTRDAFSSLVNGKWPQIIGIIWWNSAWPNDKNPDHNTSMRIEEDKGMAELFRMTVGADERFLNQTLTGC
jgi:hypothetical protein